jgi:hypothetical protein
MARPAPIGASWFETALTRLLTMRVRERRLEGWAAKRLPTRICILAARFARVLLTPPPSESRGRREGRVAACTRVSRKEELREREKPQVQAVITPAFPARWFTAYTCSSVNHSVCHRRLRKACQLSVLLGLSARPRGARTTRFRRTQMRRSSHDTPTSTAFRTTFVTTRTPLSSARNGSTIRQIRNSENKNIFAAGLDVIIARRARRANRLQAGAVVPA